MTDAIGKLKERRDLRQLEDMKRSGADISARFEKLRAMKPDHHARPKEDDRLF
jgi:hypothetical protein